MNSMPAFAWNAGGHLLRQGLNLGFVMVQARFLSPKDFGLVALAATAIGFADLAGQMGLASAIIHRREIDSGHLSSAFWLSLAMGIVMTIVFLIGAPVVARFFSEPLLVPILTILTVNALASATTTVPNAMAGRGPRPDELRGAVIWCEPRSLRCPPCR